MSELFSSLFSLLLFFFPVRVEEEERVPVYMSRRWGEMPFRRPQHHSNPVSSSSHQTSCYRDTVRRALLAAARPPQQHRCLLEMGRSRCQAPQGRAGQPWIAPIQVQACTRALLKSWQRAAHASWQVPTPRPSIPRDGMAREEREEQEVRQRRCTLWEARRPPSVALGAYKLVLPDNELS